MRRRRCDRCGQSVPPRIDRCPACGGEVRVTICEPGQGEIEYVLRKTPPRDPRETFPFYEKQSTQNQFIKE